MTSWARINGTLLRAAPSLAAVCLLLHTVAGSLQAQNVELTVLSQAGATLETHQWARTLDRAGFDRVRIQSTDQDRIVLEAVTVGKTIRVTGLLDASHRLRLPGGSFSRNDVAGLARWLERLKAGDREGGGPGFGLTPDELTELSRQLGSQTSGATAGKEVMDVLTELSDQLKLPLQISNAARNELDAADPVFDEAEGLAAGTVMAAILRPWGLALVPKKSRGAIALQVVPFEDAPEFWPVGWPPQTAVTKLARKLYEREQIQINDVSLREAMEALQPLMGLPLLWDHNGMARQSIDPDEVRVSFPSATTTFKRVLARVLSQAKLKSEVRVDEAGQPFLWIAPKRS